MGVRDIREIDPATSLIVARDKMRIQPIRNRLSVVSPEQLFNNEELMEGPYEQVLAYNLFPYISRKDITESTLAPAQSGEQMDKQDVIQLAQLAAATGSMITRGAGQLRFNMVINRADVQDNGKVMEEFFNAYSIDPLRVETHHIGSTGIGHVHQLCVVQKVGPGPFDEDFMPAYTPDGGNLVTV